MLLYCKVRSPGNEIDQKGSLVCSCVFPLRHCKAEAVVGDGLFRVTPYYNNTCEYLLFILYMIFLGNLQRRMSTALFRYG